jgi:hypothetical protein
MTEAPQWLQRDRGPNSKRQLLARRMSRRIGVCFFFGLAMIFDSLSKYRLF